MRNLSTWAAVLCIAALSACHPVKQIQKQDAGIDQLKAKWIGEWALDHPCPPMPEINLDSLCRLYYPAAKGGDFSFEIVDSVGPSVADSLRLLREMVAASKKKAALPAKPPERILVPYEDRRTINLLQDSLRSKNNQIAALQAGRDVKAQDCTESVKAADKKTTKWIWLFVAACAVIAGGGGLWAYSSLKRKL